MRRGALVGLVVLGCSGTRGGVLPDAREYDATVDPCADLGDWATREARTIARAGAGVTGMAADDTYVYWSEPGAAVLRAPLAGGGVGEPEVLFVGGEDPSGGGALAATRDHVFVILGGQLWRVAKDGMEADVVAIADELAADLAAVYYFEAGQLVRLTADTLQPSTVGVWEGLASELQLSAGSAWWLAREPLAIWRMTLSDGMAGVAAQIDQSGDGGGLAVAGGSVAFLGTWGAPEDPGSPPFLTRVGLDTGTSEPMIDLVDSGFAVEVDDAHVYWLEPAAGRLSRMPVEGGCVETRPHEGDSLAMTATPEGIVVATGGIIALVER